MAPVSDCPETLYARLVVAGAERFESRPALRCGTRRWNYGELKQAVDSTAKALSALGVQEGDRLLFVLSNSPEFVVAFLATTSLGAIAVPIDYQAGPERLSFIAEDTTPVLCLRSAGREMPADFPLAHHAIEVDDGPRGVRLDPAPSAVPAGEAAGATVADDADAVILFSAGSTGRPKGARLQHRHLMRIARTLVDIVGMDGDHRELILSPMTHSGGWQRVTSTLLAGGLVVVAEPPITIPGLLEDVRDHAIRGFFAAPPLLRALLMTDAARVQAALSSLRSIESASAPLAPAELDQLMRLLPDVRVLWQYGLTECSRALILDTRAYPDKLNSVGRPTPGVEVIVCDDDGERLENGRKGEVWLAAPQRTERYWNRPDLNRERFTGRWLRTGDVGSLDDDGFLTFHGRRDDLINCGGLSFFPAEVEKELGPVPGVTEYLIAGVPDPRGILEHVAWAFVVPENPDAWSPKELHDQARRRLPPHMVPRRVVPIPSMPLIAVGKPDRRGVVAKYGPQANG